MIEPKHWNLEDITPEMTEETCRRIIAGEVLDMIVVYPPCLHLEDVKPGDAPFIICDPDGPLVPFYIPKIRIVKE